MKTKILITCPPMIRSIGHVAHHFETHNIEYFCPDVTQTLSEEELIELVPQYDGWIIGDDPATRAVFQSGMAGRLKAAVKWGVGIDNVDLAAARELGLPIANTPTMFGTEVADVALGYVIALARQLYEINRAVREGGWPKPAGTSLAGKSVALVGFGDIGRNTARRLLACGMNVFAYDPSFQGGEGFEAITSHRWPDRLGEADFIILTCSLTKETRHLLNAETLAMCKRGARVVNVSRGPLIDESALIAALASGQVAGAALEVFEVEPLPAASPLRDFDQCIFGSHNASNTIEAVIRTSSRAVTLLFNFLKITPQDSK